jgi:phosphoglycerate dehydrogenase-like enzyme
MMLSRSKPLIVLTGVVNEDGMRILEDVGEVVLIEKPEEMLSEDELIRYLRDAEAVLVRRGVARITRRVIESASRLIIIARHGVGYDTIDVGAATERGVWVTTTPVEEEFEAVAEHAIALILALARKILKADPFIRGGGWYRSPNDVLSNFVGFNLSRKILGIVGLGRIGSRIARIARLGFDMDVIYYDIARRYDLETSLGLRFVDLEELLRISDFVVISLPLTEKTRGFIGERELMLMKPTAFLINISRGAIVDHHALVKALKSGRIAGAALDVFHREPLSPEDPLASTNNTILTPHMAALTREALRAMALAASNDIARALRGEDPLYPVNPEVRDAARRRSLEILSTYSR